MGDFTPDEIMADAMAGLEAAGFRPVSPAYRWSAAQHGDEHWVVRFPRHGQGRGVCRIETQEMAQTLAGMLNDAFSLGAASSYQAKWDQLRRQVSAGVQGKPGEGAGRPYRQTFEAGALESILEMMDEIEGGPPIDPQEALRARWAAENEPDPGPTDRQLMDWAEHNAHVDGMDPEAGC